MIEERFIILLIGSILKIYLFQEIRKDIMQRKYSVVRQTTNYLKRLSRQLYYFVFIDCCPYKV